MSDRFSTSAPDGAAPHTDVGSYAIGALDEYETARFEEHLIDCDECAAELESLMPVVDVLSRVDPPSYVAAEQTHREGRVLQRMMGTVGKERRRARRRALVTSAFAVVLLAVVTTLSLFAGAQMFGGDPASTPEALPTQGEQLPPDPDGPGIGGPSGGDQFQGTDPRTGVQLLVDFQEKDWGTQVNFMVRNIKDVEECRLVLLTTDGREEVVTSWKVPDAGYGTAENPNALELTAQTALERSEIAFASVQAISADGKSATMVTAPN
ncbi:hypothetical protein [Catenuloplanes atrovinosus]|uniref:Zinc-finger domain-containing protein n=1 Tax=Catenuloplanes atrovinosus TaxID=137266 RepID=A0AAE3YKM7_9ACTN|nr:hypothetical protein [Catenuloplanes atrovinosus]MDR7273561.1 hypothetical protein [Catenuloplanes atrovinosus]